MRFKAVQRGTRSFFLVLFWTPGVQVMGCVTVGKRELLKSPR